MAFNIDNYVDVPTRLAEAMKRWPNLRIQETSAEVVTMPDGSTLPLHRYRLARRNRLIAEHCDSCRALPRQNALH